MATLNLLDIITLQNNDRLTGLVEDVTTFAPEFMVIPADRRVGTQYYIAQRTAYPASQFRQINNGVTPSKSAYKKVIKEMFFMDTIINVDEAVYKADDRSTGDILSHESKGALESTMINIGAQFYYGTSNGAYGFAGLRTQLAGSVAAGGTTNSSSAYFVWLNPWGVSFDVGNDGEFAMPPFQRQQVAATTVNAGGTGHLFAWVSNISSFIGLSVKSNYSIYAVTGIDSTHKLTDAMASSLIALIPLNRRNGLRVFMNRLTHSYLQQSRTVTLFGQGTLRPNQGNIAAPPTDIEGYPITVTDSITNTESN